MITLRELQSTSGIASLRRINTSSGYISLFHNLYSEFVENKYNHEFDFEVYLPKYNINLQRPFVWNKQQMEELIWSMIYERPIPNVVVISHEFRRYEIVDGKQRLLTIKKFINNEFPIFYNSKKIYFKDIDSNAQYNIVDRMVPNALVYYSYDDDPITDDEKILIFNFFNFSGSQQEKNHRNLLKKCLSDSNVKKNTEIK